MDKNYWILYLSLFFLTIILIVETFSSFKTSFQLTSPKLIPFNSTVESFILSKNVNKVKARRLTHLFEFVGKNYNLDPLLLAQISWYESKFDENATSPTGDYGLMQINKVHLSTELIRNINDPLINIVIGGKILSQRGLKGYNSGDLDYERKIKGKF